MNYSEFVTDISDLFNTTNPTDRTPIRSILMDMHQEQPSSCSMVMSQPSDINNQQSSSHCSCNIHDKKCTDIYEHITGCKVCNKIYNKSCNCDSYKKTCYVMMCVIFILLLLLVRNSCKD